MSFVFGASFRERRLVEEYSSDSADQRLKATLDKEEV